MKRKAFTAALLVALLGSKSRHNRSATYVPHTSREAVLGCIDGRLMLAHFMRSVSIRRGAPISVSSEFLVRMAAGAAALLTKRDAESAMGQLTDAYGVRQFDKIEIQLHRKCGKLGALTEIGGEFAGELDPNNIDDLFRLGNRAKLLVIDAFRQQYGIQMPVTVVVVDIIRGWHGLPVAKYLQLPAAPTAAVSQ